MRVVKGFFIFVLTFLIAPLSAGEGVKPSLFELEGGISPNTALGLNTYFSGKVNWNGNFTSGISFFRHDYSVLNSTLEETTVKGDLTTAATLQPLEYRHVISSVGDVSRSWAIATSVGWTGAMQVNQFTEIWPDDSEVQQMYIENTKHSSQLFETSISVSFTQSGGPHSWEAALVLIPWSALLEQYQGFGFTTDPDPVEQLASYDQYFFEPESTLFGLGLEVSQDISSRRVGRWKIDGILMYRAGSSWLIERYWDESDATYVFEEYEALMQLIDWEASLTYYLPVRWMGGILPGLRLGYYGQIKLIDEYTDDLLSYQRFDFGVTFKY